MSNLEIWKDEEGKLISYAWPGGYPVVYYAKDGEVICPDCANGENGSRCQEKLDDDCPDDDQWTLVAGDIYYEGPPLSCSHCNKEIESAYGDPDENTLLDHISDITRHNDLISNAPKFKAKYLNQFDKDERLVTEEGCQLILDYVALHTPDFWSDTGKSIDFLTIPAVAQAIAELEHDIDE